MPRRRQIVAGNAATAKRQARLALGRLHDLRVAPKALLRYKLACQHVCACVIAWQLNWAPDIATLDRQLCTYLESLWAEGEGRNLAADTISGAQHFLMLRGEFPGAKSLLST